MADAFKIEIRNIDQLRAALESEPALSKRFFSRAINAALAVMSRTKAEESIFQFKTPRQLRTGLLQQSFDLGMKPASEDRLIGSIGPTVLYAPFLQFGTAAHIIRAVKAGGLANRKTGQFFGSVVHHPGTQANPYMERILKASERDINEHFDRALQLVVQGMSATS